ncbi:MAG: hypothetical protein RL065_478 [Bacteroidota bacterium]|jgi:uncharacterized YigZ family protein
MQNDETFNTIATINTAEFTDKGSKFLAIAFPIKNADEFKIELKKIKELHPKAVHHCFAYRLGVDKNNFRFSDDGEPSNTAGKPIINQIDSKKITNVAVVVVRYFGGILLGVQGLVNAYKTATQLALNSCEIIQKQITQPIKIETDYSNVSILMNFLKRHEIEISKKQIELFCSIDIEATKLQIVELEKFAEQNFGKFVIKK